MKVFISHKNIDAPAAIQLQSAFNRNGVTTYLDVLDSSIAGGGKELTDHIKNNLNTCTDLIVVMTEHTKESWWVPFEIGMSAQIDMPTASFLKSGVALPDYLSYWPRLRTIDDVAKYIMVRKEVSQRFQQQYGSYEFASRKATETRDFYIALKAKL